MDTIRGSLEGPCTFSTDTELLGSVIGDATVSSNFTLVVRGTIIGDCIANPDSNLSVYGTVQGSIHNKGAAINIEGVVNRLINHVRMPDVTISSTAVVRTLTNL